MDAGTKKSPVSSYEICAAVEDGFRGFGPPCANTLTRKE